MQSIVKGSIQDVASGEDAALALLNAKIAIIADASGSMSEAARHNKAKFQLQQEVVTTIQNRHPGHVAVVWFSDECGIALDGIIPFVGGGTDIARAFEMARELADMGIHSIFMSDGEPSTHPPDYCLNYARQYLVGVMDVIFVGAKGGAGEPFMKELAQVVRGQYSMHNFKDDPKFLTEKLEVLLLKASGV